MVHEQTTCAPKAPTKHQYHLSPRSLAPIQTVQSLNLCLICPTRPILYNLGPWVRQAHKIQKLAQPHCSRNATVLAKVRDFKTKGASADLCRARSRTMPSSCPTLKKGLQARRGAGTHVNGKVPAKKLRQPKSKIATCCMLT